MVCVYVEFPAPPLACLVIRAGASQEPILPDACSDLIWQAGRGAFVAGPDTGPAAVTAAPEAVFVGARFRPGAVGAARPAGRPGGPGSHAHGTAAGGPRAARGAAPGRGDRADRAVRRRRDRR